MIERIVLFKLVDAHVDDASRRAAAALTRESLEGAPGVQSLRVGLPADPASLRSWDLSLVLRFENLAAEQSFLESSDVAAWHDEMSDRTEVKKHWSFALLD